MEVIATNNGLFTLLLVLTVWSIPWKGVALWKSAQLYHRLWFILLLILNTAGILEIIYIFFVAKKAERRLKESEQE